MTTQEQAFHDWYENQPTFGVDYQEIWNAACKWQREQIRSSLYYCGEEYCMIFEDYRGLFNEHEA